MSRIYDIYINDEYFGLSKPLTENIDDARQSIVKEFKKLSFGSSITEDKIRIEVRLTNAHKEFLVDYSNYVAQVDTEIIEKYFATNERTHDSDHIEDCWLLWSAGVSYGQTLEINKQIK